MPVATRPPRKTGTERLLCLQGCETSVYMTTAAIRRGPLPMCGHCAARLCPEHPELAAEILEPAQWETHPYLEMSARATWSALKGQAASVQRGQWRHLETPDEKADHAVARAMRDDAAARRAATLCQNAYRAAGAPEPF